MNFKATKTPLLIAAIATAFMITSFLPASAKPYWISAQPDAAQVHTAVATSDDSAVVHDAGFKFAKKKKFHKKKFHKSRKFHHSPRRHHGHFRQFGGKKYKFSGHGGFKTKKKFIIKKKH